ncbi:MAG TPA: 50S ribosomal protein L11 methyltransferase [Alphaproteobacteria bacterium]
MDVYQMWHAQFFLHRDPALRIQPVLQELFDTVIYHQDDDEDEDYLIELIFEDEPSAESISAALKTLGEEALDNITVKVEALPQIDWLQHVYDQLQPIDAGSFFVYGSHYKETLPEGKIPLLIEAATGFGTGEHPTTQGCLTLCDIVMEKAPDITNIFDLGCGSGILGIGAAKLWPKAKIIGVDIDEQSVQVAQNHKETNGVGDAVLFLTGDGLDDPLVKERAPFDLVFANILAQPLIDFAEGIVEVTKKGGFIILSGFLNNQAERVLAPYQNLNCSVVKTIEINNWQAVLLIR